MKENFTNTFTGVLDTDSDPTQVSQHDFVASLNMRQYPNQKTRRNIRGNEIVPYTQPAGINETVGHVEDKFKATGIEFVKNNAGNDQIRRFWSLEDRYELLLQMDMGLDNHISEAGVIDGKHLFWTDYDGSTGNEPRYLDMELASLYQKQLCYELYWDSASFDALEEYSIEIVNIDGTVVLPQEVFFTATGGDPDGDAADLAAALAGYDVEVEPCNNKIKVCAANAEERIIITGQGIHFSPVNHYPETMISAYISLIRMMPKQPPIPRFVNDSTITENKVFGFVFQFRYRYVYWNGSKSKWSPISYVPTNFIDDGLTPKTIDNSELYNKVVIEFDDEILDSQDWKAFIRRVELAVRYEQTGPWKFIEAFDIADMGVSVHELDFLNDGTYPEVASDEVATGDVQAIGNYDFVPRFARALEIVQDETGRHLLSLGGNTEQYGQVDCVDALIENIAFIPDPAPTTPTDQSSLRKAFKSGGIYDVFIRYEDDFGRQWPDKKIGRFNCVNPTGNTWSPQLVYPKVTINHVPPIEATRYRIAFSVNQNQGQYVTLPCYSVGYWTKEPHPTGGDGTFTSTSYAAGDAAYVSFLFYNKGNDALTNFIFRDIEQNMLVQTGDRLHVILDTNVPGFTDDDYVVEGYNIGGPAGTSSTDENYYVFIKFVPGMPDYTISGGLSDHHVIELYRPFNGNSGINYEVGPAYDIIDAGLSTRNHGSPIDIDTLGDAYTWAYNDRNVLGSTTDVLVQYVERPSLYAFKKEVGSDFGRASAEDADFKRVDSYDQIRLSDFYIPSSGINGFSSFRGTNYIRTRRDYGAIQSLQYLGEVLLSIGQFASQPIYVSKDRLMTLSGETVGRSANVLNIGPPLLQSLGTFSPMSIVNTGRYIYGFDDYRGVPWRYSIGGGQDPIQGKNVQLFRSLGADVFTAGYKCVAGYQEAFDTYFITFGELRTLGYNEGRGWEGDFSFVPDIYGSIGLRFFSFDTGNAYEHEKGDYCHFYGLDSPQSYTNVIVNPQPQAVKLFWNFRIQGDKAWVPYATIPDGIVPGGMETRIIAAKFVKKEGQWKAEIPRDGNDPAFAAISPLNTRFVTSILRGRRMRGETMLVQIHLHDPQVDGVIRRLDTEWSPSMETK